MPKLLMITTVATMIRSFLLPFARHYRALGWRVDAAADGILALNEIHAEFDACHDLVLSRNPTDIQVLINAPAMIRQIVLSGAYDIVHVHSPVAAFLVRFALRNLANKPKVIYTAHGFHFHRYGHPLSNFIFKSLEKIAAPWCDVLVTINQEDYQAAIKNKFSTRVEYMQGIGVDTHLYNRQSITQEQINIIRVSLNLKPTDTLFLMIAEFNIGKRHRDILQALMLTPPTVHVAFAGIGKLQEQIKQQANNLGLAERVHFLGFRRDIPLLISCSRAVLLPSEREGLPRSLLEAMSLSVPIIASDIRGITELADDNCGLLHQVGNIQQISAALTQLAENEFLAQEMGKNAKNKIINYDISEIVKKHDELYNSLLTQERHT